MSRNATRFVVLLILAALAFTPARPAGAKGDYKLKFATLAPDGTPWSAILHSFKGRLEEKTNKEIRVKLYLNGILGDERAMLEQMQFHKITGGGFTSAGISSVVPELQVVELPYLFRDYEEIDHVLDQVLWQEMQKRFKEKGLFLYCWAENGWHDFGFTGKRVGTWKDFSGTKVASQESEVSIADIESLGGTAVPLAVPDILSALQTGLVEAYTTTPVYAIAGQWFTQTKYWWDTGHVYQPAAVVFDLKFWEELPQEYRDIIMSFQQELQASARKDVRGIDEGILKDFAAQGIEVVRLSAEERAKMSGATEAAAERLIDKGVVSKELWARVQKALADFRAKKK